MTFQMDEEATLDAMAHASTVDLFNGYVTLYGVACVGSDDDQSHSHGGQLSLTATEAIEAAHECNADNPTGCRYLAFACGLSIEDLTFVFTQLREAGWEPDGN